MDKKLTSVLANYQDSIVYTKISNFQSTYLLLKIIILNDKKLPNVYHTNRNLACTILTLIKHIINLLLPLSLWEKVKAMQT